MGAIRAIATDLRARHRTTDTVALNVSLAGGDAAIAIFFSYLDRALPRAGYDANAG